ncbi:MAG: Fur family transcriptional regulator [Candidatus Lutibacillus vidarii]|jgi:Fur family ferric uptake transcriptional regulator|nr:transcriptional repressor [Candidatus Lutibacillus vidarii]HON73986.1 Fur family transcriptional regulator [Dermatophilaceae bacterium]HRB99289.1 Fur family transcriptional regulator [Dermatophilaceae bacterium]
MSTRRPTRQRAAVEALLRTSDDFVSAQAIHARLRETGDAVGLATVYRTLQAMSAEGLVDVLRTDDGEAVYRRCSESHHHHLVCRSCGRTVEVEIPAVERSCRAVSEEHGFTDVVHTVEIFGTCPGCR